MCAWQIKWDILVFICLLTISMLLSPRDYGYLLILIRIYLKLSDFWIVIYHA